MLLIQDPALLMLDEPVAGMSVSERKKTAELLHRIIENRSVLVIEHDMGFVADIAHKVTVLHQGRVISEGSMAHVQSDRAGRRSLSRSLREGAMLETTGLRVSYGQSEVLHGLDIKVALGRDRRRAGPQRHGQVHADEVANRTDPLQVWRDPAEGRRVLTGLKSHKRVEKGIAYVPQGRMIFSAMTVQENIETGLVRAAQVAGAGAPV